jgi:hypothetical protein
VLLIHFGVLRIRSMTPKKLLCNDPQRNVSDLEVLQTRPGVISNGIK